MTASKRLHAAREAPFRTRREKPGRSFPAFSLQTHGSICRRTAALPHVDFELPPGRQSAPSQELKPGGGSWRLQEKSLEHRHRADLQPVSPLNSMEGGQMLAKLGLAAALSSACPGESENAPEKAHEAFFYFFGRLRDNLTER